MLSKSASFDSPLMDNVTEMNGERTRFTAGFCKVPSLLKFCK
jgi:hypothetical protein